MENNNKPKDKKEGTGHGPKPGIKRIEIWLDQTSYDKLEEMKKTSGLFSKAEVLRQLIMNGKIQAALTKEEKTDIKNLRKMGVNLWALLTELKRSGMKEMEKKFMDLYDEYEKMNLHYRRRLYKINKEDKHV